MNSDIVQLVLYFVVISIVCVVIAMGLIALADTLKEVYHAG